METTVLSLASLALNELEAFIELMFLAAYTDGKVTEVERAAFRGQVVKGTHGQLDAGLVDQMLGAIEARMADADRDETLGSIRERLADPRKRRAALAHAARVVLADGVLDVSEVAFMERAAAALGESKETVERMLSEADEG
ncbi:MAG: TerB family tellurite resistance protein [Minicystis sp.]